MSAVALAETASDQDRFSEVRIRHLERGLRLIAGEGCQHAGRSSGLACWDSPDHERPGPYERYKHDCWCVPCIARATLEGRLPLPPRAVEAPAALPCGGAHG